MKKFKPGDKAYYFQDLDLKEETVMMVHKTVAFIGYQEKMMPLCLLYKSKLEALDAITEAMFELHAELRGNEVAKTLCTVLMEGEGVSKNVD